VRFVQLSSAEFSYSLVTPIRKIVNVTYPTFDPNSIALSQGPIRARLIRGAKHSMGAIMHRVISAICALIFCGIALGATADAKPNVVLKLSGVLVERDQNGVEKTTAVEKAQLKPGDVVRYVIVASNAGTDAARNLVPIGQVPAGTAFMAGSAASKEVPHVEYSLDGGKTWSAAPTVRVHTPAGDVVKKADPAAYTSLRWVDDKPLAPKGSATFVYTVRVK